MRGSFSMKEDKKKSRLKESSSFNRTINRTIIRKVRSVLSLSLVMAFYFSSTGFAEEKENEPQLAAQSAVLLDGVSGRILYEKNGDEVRPMASTTKIMTCIIALENAQPDDVVTVSSKAASMPEVRLKIKAGEDYRMEDLLYSLMLESHNDSAVAVAEHLAGSVERFADRMNQKAAMLGCTRTNFVTPNGLDALDKQGMPHATTAKELAKLLRYCIFQSPECESFLRITRAPSHTFSDISGKRSFSCINHNALLNSMDGAISGKTGFTGNAGYCYVGAVKREGKTFIAALLGCGWPPNKTLKWQDMRKLIDYGNKNYRIVDLLEEKTELSKVKIRNGIEEESFLYAEYPEGATFPVLMKEGERVTIKKNIPESLTAPMSAGTRIGQIDYYVENEPVLCIPVKTRMQVELYNFDFCVKSLLNCYFL